MENKILMILGMHRSGTSLITKWLHLCGLNIGKDLLVPDAINSGGYFEDLDFMQLHEQILRIHHFPASGIIELPVIKLSPYEEAKLNAIVEIKNKLYHQWGWKDPRTCLFLDVYQKVIPNANKLFIIRNSSSIVNSLVLREFKFVENRYLIPRGKARRIIWNLYNKKKILEHLFKTRAEHFLRSCIFYMEAMYKQISSLPVGTFMVIDYKMMMKQSENVFSVIKDKWGFQLNYFDFGTVYNENLISAKRDIEKYISDKSLITKADETYKKMQAYLYK